MSPLSLVEIGSEVFLAEMLREVALRRDDKIGEARIFFLDFHPRNGSSDFFDGFLKFSPRPLESFLKHFACERIRKRRFILPDDVLVRGRHVNPVSDASDARHRSRGARTFPYPAYLPDLFQESIVPKQLLARHPEARRE